MHFSKSLLSRHSVPNILGFVTTHLVLLIAFNAIVERKVQCFSGPPWDNVLVEDLTLIQTISKVSAFYAIQRFTATSQVATIDPSFFHVSVGLEWNQVYYYCGHLLV
jgi:hypothetical protein